jgi:hypothetical protein
MAKKSVLKLALLALLLSRAAATAAFTVGVTPAEGIGYAPPPEGTGSPLGYLVSGCVGAFFDAGYIVTDDSVFRGPRSAWGKPDFALAGAREGLVDCLIAMYVDWKPSAFRKEALLPSAIAYRILRVADGKVLAEGELDGIPDSVEAGDHYIQAASRAGTQAASSWIKILKTLAMGGER